MRGGVRTASQLQRRRSACFCNVSGQRVCEPAAVPSSSTRTWLRARGQSRGSRALRVPWRPFVDHASVFSSRRQPEHGLTKTPERSSGEAATERGAGGLATAGERALTNTRSLSFFLLFLPSPPKPRAHLLWCAPRDVTGGRGPMAKRRGKEESRHTWKVSKKVKSLPPPARAALFF